MSRTTADAVGGIIEVDSGVSVLPFIEIANALVEELLADLFNDTRLELIERWLSAHFFACEYPRVSAEAAGPVSASYQQRVGLGLELTSYGQQVKILDTSGTLAQLDANSKTTKVRITKQAKVHWVGIEKEI